MEQPGDMHGKNRKYVRNSPEICMERTGSMYGTVRRYAWNDPEVCIMEQPGGMYGNKKAHPSSS